MRELEKFQTAEPFEGFENEVERKILKSIDFRILKTINYSPFPFQNDDFEKRQT